MVPDLAGLAVQCRHGPCTLEQRLRVCQMGHAQSCGDMVSPGAGFQESLLGKLSTGGGVCGSWREMLWSVGWGKGVPGRGKSVYKGMGWA